MKFEIQEFGMEGEEAENVVYFSLHVSGEHRMNERVALWASNAKGKPGQEIVVIRSDGKLYRPQIAPIKGLTRFNGYIEMG